MTKKIQPSSSDTVKERVQRRIAFRQKWREFTIWIQDHQSPRWVFRGQPQAWPLKPSVGRVKAYKPEAEILLFNEFRRAALPFINRSLLQNEWDWLAMAQHHGLPTRLIDWTSNPLVATYFASQHSPRQARDGEIIAVEARTVGFYRPEDPEEENPFKITKEKFLYPPALATRISAQRGLFSIHPNPQKPWRLREKTDQFTIPSSMKNDFQRGLFTLGVDAGFLMADLDGLSKTLSWRFENRILGE